MLASTTAIVHNEAFHIGLVLTALGFGFRHGIDWDHIAALTDLTNSQDNARRSMLFATLYALGHALVVAALGFGAIVLSAQLPAGVDTVMERVVGATLVGLGIFVIWSLIQHGRDFRMRSRWMLLFSGVRAGYRKLVTIVHNHEHDLCEVHEYDHEHELVTVGGGTNRAGHTRHAHPHRHVGSMPDDPFVNYGRGTSFGVGMLHGIGAETPTQVLIFLAAAGAGGVTVGLLLLACFIVGLLASNTLIALAATAGFLGATKNFKVYATVSALTAGFSLVIGSLFLFGSGSILPAIFGG
jgi:high-affinity nickel-transport protein